MEGNKKSPTVTNIFIFTLYFVIVLSVGCFLFFNGFLLMRYELPLKSQCNQSPLPNQLSDINGCWMNKTFNKAVIIVIDALRYDFLEEQPVNDSKTSIYFHNRLPSIQKLIKDKPDNTLFFKFVADSPTVTMQRIKGITTGSLPTFIDVGSNFGGEAIVEDTLVNQLVFKDSNKEKGIDNLRNKVIFIGDDTWVSLFPNHFYQEYPYPSFNVKDIDTVDNGVLKHLLPTITQIDGEWDVAISHLLGVDHVGHTFGPDHPEMIRKMKQMDEFLISIIDNIKNDTLFILMGDHGMTSDGNHGGASILETDAALLMFSPSIRLNNSKDIPKEILKSRLSSVPLDHYNSHIPRDISQIDLVSTLSLLLGVPIPFGNLGSIIPEVFYSSVNSNNKQDHWDNLFNALRINTFQIKRYMESYSNISKDFPKYKLNHFKQLLDKTESLYDQYINNKNQIDPAKVYNSYIQYHQEIIELCRDIWATFDLFSMNCGILIILLSGILILVFIVKIMNYNQVLQFPYKRVLVSSIFGLLLSLPINFMFNPNEALTYTIITIFSIFGFIYYLIKDLKSTTTTPKSVIPTTETSASKKTTKSLIIYFFTLIIPLITFILHGISYTSNSFTEAQHNVVYYFEISNIVLTCINLIYHQPNWTKKDSLLVFITLFSMFLTSPTIWNVKISIIFEYFNPTPTSVFIENQLKLTILENLIESFWVLPIIYFIWKRIFKETNIKSSKSPIIHHIFLVIILISITIFWFFIQPLVSNGVQLHWLLKNIFPLIVYSLSIIGVFHSISPSNRQTQPNNDYLIIESLFKRLVYISLYFYLVILLLLGIDNSRATLLMLIQIISIILLLSKIYNSYNGINNNDSFNRKLFKYYFNFIVSILFGFLSINHFFTSNHEHSFSKIQFESAFIGFDEHFYLRDGVLVILNTFSAPIIITLSLPILLIYSKYFVFYKKKPSATERNPEFKSYQNLNEFLICFLILLLFYWFNTLLVSISVYTLRRHLMVWRVFCPKYIFETVQLLVVSIYKEKSVCVKIYNNSIYNNSRNTQYFFKLLPKLQIETTLVYYNRTYIEFDTKYVRTANFTLYDDLMCKNKKETYTPICNSEKCVIELNENQIKNFYGNCIERCIVAINGNSFCNQPIDADNYMFPINYALSALPSTEGGKLQLTGNYLRNYVDDYYIVEGAIKGKQLKFSVDKENYDPENLTVNFPPGYGTFRLYPDSSQSSTIMYIGYAPPYISQCNYKDSTITLNGLNFYNNPSVAQVTVNNVNTPIVSIDHRLLKLNYVTDYSQKLNVNVTIGDISLENIYTFDIKPQPVSISTTVSTSKYNSAKIDYVESTTEIKFKYGVPHFTSTNAIQIDRTNEFSITGINFGNINDTNGTVILNIDGKVNNDIITTSISNDETKLSFKLPNICETSVKLSIEVNGVISNNNVTITPQPTFILAPSRPLTNGSSLYIDKYFSCKETITKPSITVGNSNNHIYCTLISNTETSCNVGAGTGKHSFKFYVDGIEKINSFFEYAPPTLVSHNVNGLKTITLTGYNFGNDSSKCNLIFAKKNVTCKVISDTTITFDANSQYDYGNVNLIIDSIPMLNENYKIMLSSIIGLVKDKNISTRNGTVCISGSRLPETKSSVNNLNNVTIEIKSHLKGGSNTFKDYNVSNNMICILLKDGYVGTFDLSVFIYNEFISKYTISYNKPSFNNSLINIKDGGNNNYQLEVYGNEFGEPFEIHFNTSKGDLIMNCTFNISIQHNNNDIYNCSYSKINIDSIKDGNEQLYLKIGESKYPINSTLKFENKKSNNKSSTLKKALIPTFVGGAALCAAAFIGYKYRENIFKKIDKLKNGKSNV
ncbi:hypothetical protein DICPUDRAFT_147575 [Dictyostelium purpureum]|uniref:Uncharacterized protein n=1 Tax=Dictyostelium purpureum TaxID=5786 RepID=F0Z8V0_DICPU|nr:uncharacterized protein DICPUDRAFT_147575 [Dictyostelium purpureum]EGC39640.1 hypothetical protein DICPUDRAFT_147575 [Dictyostelium purpureum]|eukprot:XP_003283861.1 hypothetical protein DICPUDRAFT_147575 [Dictyostelium purpureum]